MKIQLYGYTDIGSRSENEDSLAYAQLGADRFYAAVADGLGGHKGGRAASQTAIRYLASSWEETVQLPTAVQLQERLAAANGEILTRRQSADQMKSTAAALYVWGDRAIWLHIGDSRLYHFHDGVLVHYTRDHSVPQISVQLGEIVRDQIPDHPDRNRLLRALGSEEAKPEIEGPVALAPGEHAFLLCSDGLWEHLHEDELLLDLSKSLSPKQWIDYLRCRRERRKKPDTDNNTAIAAFVEVPR